jgi:hypothetical protein
MAALVVALLPFDPLGLQLAYPAQCLFQLLRCSAYFLVFLSAYLLQLSDAVLVVELFESQSFDLADVLLYLLVVFPADALNFRPLGVLVAG